MIKNIWKQKKVKTWDEAFRGLTPVMRQHSVRVADYTQVLFVGVCKSSYYTLNRDTPVYMDEAYADVAYKCGFYHQIGKSLNPGQYPAWRDDFTDEEKMAYCKYTVDGRVLVERLQDEYDEEVSVASRMIREACEQHMERWDGEGFPYGYFGEDISLIAQIVSLAKELDRLVCERKSESPFEEAVELLLAQENRMFSPNLMEVFRACQAELKSIYKKYIQYTRIMPKTVPLVERRPERPFGLNYRQIVMGEAAEARIYEAVPWFGGVLDKPEEKESAELVEELLVRAGLINDITTYFLYEAADLLARMKNCELQTGGVQVPVFAAFYKNENQAERLQKLYEDTAIDKNKLFLTVPESILKEDRLVCECLSEYIAQGIVLVLDEYDPDNVPEALIREIGFTHVRIARDCYTQQDINNRIQELKSHGITVIDWPAGEAYLSEEELIKDLLSCE